MPEHDTFDLDAAFARLEQDIAGVSSPRGAGLAVATARRRRRTTFGAAAAVAVLAVGGVVLGQGLGQDHAVAPADQLPVPAPLDGPHLNAATRDWTPAWGPQTDAGQAKFSETFGGPCLAGPRHGRAGLVTLANDHVDVAFAAMSDYGSHSVVEATDWFKIERRMAGCHRAHQVSSFSDASGALGRTYRIDAAPSDTAPEYLWIVSTGREIGVLKIFGQSDPLPSANDRPVADALLAAVQMPESYVLSRTSTGQTTIGISATDFGAALGDWQSGWSATGGKRDLGSMRCEADISRDALYGQGTFLGANGDQETFGFDTPAAARKAMRSVGTGARELLFRHVRRAHRAVPRRLGHGRLGQRPASRCRLARAGGRADRVRRDSRGWHSAAGHRQPEGWRPAAGRPQCERDLVGFEPESCPQLGRPGHGDVRHRHQGVREAEAPALVIFGVDYRIQAESTPTPDGGLNSGCRSPGRSRIRQGVS